MSSRRHSCVLRHRHDALRNDGHAWVSPLCGLGLGVLGGTSANPTAALLLRLRFSLELWVRFFLWTIARLLLQCWDLWRVLCHLYPRLHRLSLLFRCAPDWCVPVRLWTHDGQLDGFPRQYVAHTHTIFRLRHKRNLEIRWFWLRNSPRRPASQ